jgi:hypothetical protein
MNMSGLRGEFAITYAELVEIFGAPNYGPNNYDMDKVTCEWMIEFEDGTRASIYDYKTGRTPMGEYEWHIGGYDMDSVDRVVETITLHRDRLVRMVRNYAGA